MARLADLIAHDLALDRVAQVEDLLRSHHLQRTRPFEGNAVDIPDASWAGRHHHNPVGQEDRLINRVGYQYDGGSGVEVDLLDQVVHFLAGEGVERPERFVHQENGRLEGQRPDQGDPLLHAAREFSWHALAETLQADPVHQLVYPGLVGLLALYLERKANVGVDGAPREKIGILDHHADVRMGPADRLPVEGDFSPGEAVQARHCPEKRGLAAA